MKDAKELQDNITSKKQRLKNDRLELIEIKHKALFDQIDLGFEEYVNKLTLEVKLLPVVEFTVLDSDYLEIKEFLDSKSIHSIQKAKAFYSEAYHKIHNVPNKYLAFIGNKTPSEYLETVVNVVGFPDTTIIPLENYLS